MKRTKDQLELGQPAETKKDSAKGKRNKFQLDLEEFFLSSNSCCCRNFRPKSFFHFDTID